MHVKDYNKIAEAIKDSTTKRSEQDMTFLAIKLANYFKDENPEFNVDKFLIACSKEN